MKKMQEEDLSIKVTGSLLEPKRVKVMIKAIKRRIGKRYTSLKSLAS